MNEQIVELSEWDIEFVDDEPRVQIQQTNQPRWTWAMENAQTVIYRLPSSSPQPRRAAGY